MYEAACFHMDYINALTNLKQLQTKVIQNTEILCNVRV